jgi:hypothetical protein
MSVEVNFLSMLRLTRPLLWVKLDELFPDKSGFSLRLFEHWASAQEREMDCRAYSEVQTQVMHLVRYYDLQSLVLAVDRVWPALHMNVVLDASGRPEAQAYDLEAD